MMVLPSTVSGMELGDQEWKDSIFLCYGIKLLDLPSHCDVCGEALSIFHTLHCKKGGLITARHNELYDGVTDLASKAFTPAHVRDNPNIFTGRAVGWGKAKGKFKGKGT